MEHNVHSNLLAALEIILLTKAVFYKNQVYYEDNY